MSAWDKILVGVELVLFAAVVAAVIIIPLVVMA